MLSESAKKSRAKYQREWRKQNPEKTKEYLKRYWEKRVLREEQQNGGEKDGETFAEDSLH